MPVEHKLVMQAFEVIFPFVTTIPQRWIFQRMKGCLVVFFNALETTQTDVIHDFWFLLPEGLLELEGHQQRKYDSGQRVPLPEIPEPRGFMDKVS